MVDFNVNGKTAVVTGGTRGLGLYTAEAYVLGGAKSVVIPCNNQCERTTKWDDLCYGVRHESYLVISGRAQKICARSSPSER